MSVSHVEMSYSEFISIEKSQIQTERQRLVSKFISAVPCGFVINRDRSTSC